MERLPPKWIMKILSWWIDPSILDEIQGDLLELFQMDYTEQGKVYATRRYLKNVLLSIRNYNLRRFRRSPSNNSLAMIGNYLKSTIRNISKNATYSILNILGLAIGIAACLFILQYVSYEKSYDRFHDAYEDIYRVRYKVYRDGELNIDCAAAVPRVGPFMKENLPEVVDFVRAYPMSGTISYNNTSFREKRMHIVDPSFLTIFSFPLIKGDPSTALSDPYSVIITEEISKKYFGNEDPIGKTLEFDGDDKLQVTGVARNVPENSHLKFNFLISYETLNSRTRNDEGVSSSETSWGWYDFNTYVRVEPGTDPIVFDEKFADILYQERKEDFEKYNFKAEFPLQSIADIHLYSNLLQESEPEEQGDGRAVEFLSVIALFILIIAWINYVNLSTARSIDRSKEVGVRKTLGASRRQLIFQFFTEAFVLNLIALFLGVFIVLAGIRGFNILTDSRLSTAFLGDPQFWITISAIFLLGTVLSGLYPALVLSSFRPVSVLKGKLTKGISNVFFRKALVVFQFVASVGLIAGTLIVYQQLNHLRKLDLGFDMSEMVVVNGPRVFGQDSLFPSTNESFKNELKQLAFVESVTNGSNVPGDEIFWTNGIRRNSQSEDANKIIYNVGIDYNYFDTYDIDVVAGRSYNRSHQTDTGSVILNARAIEYLGFKSPEATIGDKVFFWNKPWTVIGVVDDYNQMTAKQAVSPLIFHLQPDNSGYYTIRLKENTNPSALNSLQSTYESFYPGNPFDYFFLDDFFNRQYNNDHTFSRVFTLFALFAIFVACLGLFGLSSFNVVKRSKEIGVRKVLGASVWKIVNLLSREFLMLLLLANLIAWPIIYWIMNNWLNTFASRISIGIWSFLIAGACVLVIAMGSVSLKIVQAARANPVDAIRDE